MIERPLSMVAARCLGSDQLERAGYHASGLK